MLRTARLILSGGMDKVENDESGVKSKSQLDWLQYHHTKEGVENVILWLGANNALGTVLDLKINQSSEGGDAFKMGVLHSFLMKNVEIGICGIQMTFE